MDDGGMGVWEGRVLAESGGAMSKSSYENR